VLPPPDPTISCGLQVLRQEEGFSLDGLIVQSCKDFDLTTLNAATKVKKLVVVKKTKPFSLAELHCSPARADSKRYAASGSARFARRSAGSQREFAELQGFESKSAGERRAVLSIEQKKGFRLRWTQPVQLSAPPVDDLTL
jgi:hypothetical protein